MVSAGWRLVSAGPAGGRRSLGDNRVAFHFALKNQRGPNANAAHKNNQVGIEVVLDLGVRIVMKRRHEDLIDGLLLFRFRRRIGGRWDGFFSAGFFFSSSGVASLLTSVEMAGLKRLHDIANAAACGRVQGF